MTKFNKKIIIAIYCLSFLFWSPVVYGVDKLDPEVNPLCWTKKECEETRASLGYTTGEGWVLRADCGDETSEWGGCLPAGAVTTIIGVGGQHYFTDIGNYIDIVYRYIISISSVVAVVVIIIAGVQWIVSGGSSEAIGAAKNRISGALIGLVILFSSYVILNTINPALVKLKLPQSWLVRNVPAPYLFCNQTSKMAGKIVAVFTTPFDEGTSSEQLKAKYAELSKTNNLMQAGDPKNDTTFVCGKKFLVQGLGGNYCLGYYCSDNKKFCQTNQSNKHECLIDGDPKVKKANTGGPRVDSGPNPYVQPESGPTR